jgi:microcystin-dependent protein
LHYRRRGLPYAKLKMETENKYYEIGEIKMFAGDFAPADWAFCDGTLLSRSENAELFKRLGTSFGSDGKDNFALPDLRGRSPLHQSEEVPAVGTRLSLVSKTTEQSTPQGYGVNFIIALKNIEWPGPILGEMMMFAGKFAPKGWAACDGSLLSTQKDSALFSILKNIYGGDGKETFALPDLRGKIPVGAEPGQIGTRIEGSGVSRGSTMVRYLYINFIIAINGIYPKHQP